MYVFFQILIRIMIVLVLYVFPKKQYLTGFKSPFKSLYKLCAMFLVSFIKSTLIPC